MSELPEKQVKRLKSLIQEAETNLAAAKELLMSILGDDGQIVTPVNSREDVTGKIIEGVFDGQTMVGPDGKNYPVPANYASKSKLVEGDILKLTIASDGGFIYKQIGQSHASRSLVRSFSMTVHTMLKRRAKSIVSYLRASPTSVLTLAIKLLSSCRKTTQMPAGQR